MIERPEHITTTDIDRAIDIHVRRCMIERMTPERFIESGAPFRISEDDTGILWEKRWPDGDAWAAIEVVNGTPEPDGTRKRYFLQVPPNMLTARSAVAWTYGLTSGNTAGSSCAPNRQSGVPGSGPSRSRTGDHAHPLNCGSLQCRRPPGPRQ